MSSKFSTSSTFDSILQTQFVGENIYIDFREVVFWTIDDSIPETPLVELVIRGGAKQSIGGGDAQGFIDYVRMHLKSIRDAKPA